MALVLRADRDLALGVSSGKLAVVDEARAILQRGEDMEERRIDRERHHHRQIWTKDAHGGPYRKAAGTTGYDALLHLPSGCEKPVEPGYERPEAGLTTNFVGNHMTQGAIDLVQMQLRRPQLKRHPLLTAGGQQTTPKLASFHPRQSGDIQAPPSLAAIRKTLRAQRAAASSDNIHAAPTALSSDCTQSCLLRSDVQAAETPRLQTQVAGLHSSIKAADAAANEACRLGDYASALQQLSTAVTLRRALGRDGGAAPKSVHDAAETDGLCQLLLRRATCHLELGAVDEAINDCTAAIDCATTSADANQALLARARSYSEADKGEAAAADIRNIAEAGVEQAHMSLFIALKRSLAAAKVRQSNQASGMVRL